MATPRKRFFTVECSLYREPWPREIKLTLVMLGMHMTDRWAADGLTPNQATVAHLTDGDLMTVTGAPTRAEALEILRQLSSVLTLVVQPLENGFTRIEWRKLAKTQWSQSRKSGSKSGRSRDKVSPKIAPSHPHPHPHPIRSEESEKREEHPSGGEAPLATAPRVVSREPLLRLLTSKSASPPVDDAERRLWLDEVGDSIDSAALFEARVACKSGDADPPAAAVRDAMLTILHKRWRAYLRGDRIYREAAELARMRAKAAKRAAEIAAMPQPQYDLSIIRRGEINS